MTRTITQRKAAAQAAGFVNDYQVARAYASVTGKPVPPYIGWRPAEGRSPILEAWLVVRPGFKTDPKAHWADHGCKSFDAYPSKLDGLAAAQEWAAARYGVTGWMRLPEMADSIGQAAWHPAEVVAWLRGYIAEGGRAPGRSS